MSKYQTFICDFCGSTINNKRANQERKYERKKGLAKRSFCNSACFDAMRTKDNKTLECKYCKKIIIKTKSDLQKVKNSFCNSSCAAKYNNANRTKSRRSKMEIYLFDLLALQFPALIIIANDKKMLDGYEIDIAIPELKIGIEWNGIVHFYPIYGQAKLDIIQRRDAEKQKIALDKNITLVVIPDLVSTKKNVENVFVKIKEFIDSSIIRVRGYDPPASPTQTARSTN